MKKIYFNALIFCFLLSSQISMAQVTVFHNISPSYNYFETLSPDGKHFAVSDKWMIHIWDAQGFKIGEYYDRFPRITTRKEFNFWDIERSRSNFITFLNNEELAVVENNLSERRRILIIGLDGNFKRELIIPGEKFNEMGIKDKGEHGRQSEISKIFVSPDGDKIVTIEPRGGYFCIRDRNFKELKAIRLDGNQVSGGSFVEILDLKFLPDSSGFLLKTRGQEVKDGFVSFITHYDVKGNVVKGILTDQWTTSIDTPYGKIPRENDSKAPEKWDISPDGKYLVFMECAGNIDKKLLGTYKEEQDHPVGSFKERPYQVAYCIRKLEIKTGKQFQSYILKGGDNTLKTRKTNWPITDPYAMELYFAQNSKDYIGFSSYGIYHLNDLGKISAYYPHPKNILNTENALLSPDRQKIISNIYFEKYICDIKANPIGHVQNIAPAFNSSTTGSQIRVSHQGNFLTIDKGKGSDSILMDAKTGKITREKASIYWDNKDQEYRLGADYKTIRVNYKESEVVIPIQKHVNRVFPFANQQVGVSDNGLVLLDKDGNAVQKYPKSTFYQYFAMHPSLKHYMAPNVDAKVKTMIKVSIAGQKISDFLVGSFFSTIIYSPDGSLLIGSQDNAGCISIWDDQGKLVKYPGQHDNRFFDLQPDPIIGLAMTMDNRFLFTGTVDSIIITDLKTGARAKLTIFFSNKDEKSNDVDFVISDSKGRFDHSPGAKSRVSLMEKGKNKTKELWDDYYTQGLMWKFLQGQ
jgi:WD40 repeat protein